MDKRRLLNIGVGLLSVFVLALACSSAELDPRDAGVDSKGGGAPTSCIGNGLSDLGGPCPCSSDCRAGLLCTPESRSGWPQGECVAGCTDDSGCPDDGWFCFKFEPTDSLGICTKRCQNSDDCGDDRHWCLFEECQAACSRGDQCLSGHCNPSNHLCDDGSPPTGQIPLLGKCLRDEDCALGECVRANPSRCEILCAPDRPVCPSGTACQNSGCRPLCRTSADCPEPWICDAPLDDPNGQRYCLYREREQICSGVTAVVGEPCGCDADCSDGLPCQAANSLGNTVPFGMCVSRCDLFLEGSGQQCPAGQACIPNLDPDGIDNGSCVKGCNAPSDCQRGRVCSLERGCVPFCQSDSDCEGTGKACDRYTGDCLTVPNDRLPIGEPCNDPAECAGIRCISGDGESWFCSARCSKVGQACPQDAVCVDFQDSDMGVCAPSCATTEDCPPSTSCSAGVCMPA
jgi:hypothetical protein